MSFDWKEYITLAKDLTLKSSPNQAELRTATSRIYYGAFGPCKNGKNLQLVRGSDIHEKVIKSYKESEVSHEISIGNLLDNLRQRRNEADYNAFMEFDKKKVEDFLITANKILEKLELNRQ